MMNWKYLLTGVLAGSTLVLRAAGEAKDERPNILFILSDDHTSQTCIIRKSKFPQNPKRSVRFSGKRTKRSVQKRKARNTQKAETKVL